MRFVISELPGYPGTERVQWLRFIAVSGILLIASYSMEAWGGETYIHDELTDGASTGTVTGGSWTSEGWLHPDPNHDEIFWDTGRTITEGVIEFEVKGIMEDNEGGNDGKAYFFGLYDGPGGDKEEDYFGDAFIELRYNSLVQRHHHKIKLQAGGGNGGIEEPTTGTYDWNPDHWYTFKIEFGKRGNEAVLFIDGSESASASYGTEVSWRYVHLGDVNYKGATSSYTGPAGFVYRNFKFTDDGIGGDPPDDSIQQWRRVELSFSNGSYSGNPFEIEMDATFTHGASGTELIVPAYYSGGSTWKVGFMPPLTGEWTYVTLSSDSDLNGITGAVTCTESDLPGRLTADPENPKKWILSEHGFNVPIAFRTEIFFEEASLSEFTAAADFLADNHVLLFETRLLDEEGWYGGRHDYIFEGDWRNHQFDLSVWDRFQQRLEILAERGLGVHIMFYSDDAGAPGWDGQSGTERLVIRYTIARTCGYPAVLYNTGIDIAEYRDGDDIDWFGASIREHDPYDHPVSSRYNPGSGPHVMEGQTFASHGAPTQARIGDMINHFKAGTVPVSMDDAWGENRGSHPEKDHTANDIRRAFWKCVMAGGIGGLVRGGGNGLPNDGYFSIRSIESDLESEQWLRLINPFLKEKLGATFGAMVPVEELVGGSGMYALSNTERSKILYFSIGQNDTYDSGGGDMTLKLSGLSAEYEAVWFDPRSGSETDAGSFSGGSDHVVTPPTSDDWVLLVSLPIVCGNGICEEGENCSTCPMDCEISPGQVCCEGELHDGDCCGNDDCAPDEVCENYTCTHVDVDFDDIVENASEGFDGGVDAGADAGVNEISGGCGCSIVC